ncbi:MAG: hypothetical protein WD081_08400 [Gammaproteobacteria bacterium]
MARGISGSSLVWIAVAIVVGAYAGWLSTQVDAAREQAVAAQLREQRLVEQLQQLAAQVGPRERTTDATTEALTVALLRRPDLIPFEAPVGGVFYFLEDSVEVLSDRYVYVACEDGHVMCHMLFEYEREGNEVSFRVIDGYVQ